MSAEQQPMRRLWDHVADCPRCTPHTTCPVGRQLVRQVREAVRR